MRRAILTLLVVCALGSVAAQTAKCGIDTKALVAEEVAAGARSVRFLAKMVPGFDQKALEAAGIRIGSQSGQIVTLTVPVESLGVLESNKEVLQYSISHRIAQPECNNTRQDTRTDSVQQGLGVTGDTAYGGSGVYIGITDWGFDYTHPNFSGPSYTLRIARAWDHFRLAGPAPQGFDYGTEIVGREALLEARGDTSNLYGYGTHGTHVAGISAGRGHSGRYVGQAPKADMLMCSFGLGEAEWMDAVHWMRDVADQEERRLVVNSSWGMYSFSTIDGTSLLSQAINNWVDNGTFFVTSAGNNGSSRFHVMRTFAPDTADTLRTIANYYTLASDAIGQALIMWGEPEHDFKAMFRMKLGPDVWVSPEFSTDGGDQVIYDTLMCDTARVAYRVLIEHANPFDQRPHIQMDVNRVNGSYQLQLYITAESGTVHAWNVANKKNHAGNEGAAFDGNPNMGFTSGDNYYGISEPACAEKCITVAAHRADRWNNAHTNCITGPIAAFSSYGPTIDGRQKPDLSAPGIDVVSSISSMTTSDYTAVETASGLDGSYIWSAMSGTSMSSPATTGIVALMLEANPDLSYVQVRDILKRTVRNDNQTGPLVANDSSSVRWGWGKIDALRAVNEAIRVVSIQTAEEHRLPIHVSPNPATSQVCINTGCGERQTMQVFTAEGRLVAQMQVADRTTMDVEGWPRGVYIIRIGSRTQKMVLQ